MATATANPYGGIGLTVKDSQGGEVYISEVWRAGGVCERDALQIKVGGGAHDCGRLLQHDVISEVNDVVVRTAADVSKCILSHPGPDVKLKIRRGLKVFSIVVPRKKLPQVVLPAVARADDIQASSPQSPALVNSMSQPGSPAPAKSPTPAALGPASTTPSTPKATAVTPAPKSTPVPGAAVEQASAAVGAAAPPPAERAVSILGRTTVASPASQAKPEDSHVYASPPRGQVLDDWRALSAEEAIVRVTTELYPAGVVDISIEKVRSWDCPSVTVCSS